MEINIEQLKSFSREDLASINKLLKQLDSDAAPLTKKNVEEMINSSSNHLFIARRLENKEVVGMLTLIVYRIPVWKKGWLEDLVVDKENRNKGIATRLINHAIEKAKGEGVLSLNLTSHRIKKVEANKFYKRLGFKQRDTNIYRIKL
jgi:GNAT superfamily N-acetyltransferase